MPKETEKPPQLHQEACPYCTEEIQVPYGRNLCPRCGEAFNVFDAEHPLRPKPVESGHRTRSLTDYRPSPERPESHEGRAGSSASEKGITYKNIGGLNEVITELDIMVNGSRKYPEIWAHLGRGRSKGVLLTGPPGCGKTLIAQALANETNRRVRLVQGAEIKGWKQGASEGNLISAYESVKPNGILIIDEIDAIGGKREQMVNETNASIVGTLCSLLDGAKQKDEVTVIATTNKPHMLDNALRRPGRFDLEIEISPPDVNGRATIFEIHTAGMPLAGDVDLLLLASRAHGFTGADISGVCSKLKQRLLKSAVSELRRGVDQRTIIANLVVTQAEFVRVIVETIPSLIRENYIEVSNVGWSDVGGLEKCKEELQRMVLWSFQYKEEMKKLHLRQPKGLLLYGPPGCGKTLIAKAMARESGYNFLAVNGPALVNKWVGSTEEAIRDIFWKARMARPCIIFFDEIEALAPRRGRASGGEVTDRAVSQLLVEIDGVQVIQDVFVMAATNRADLVDSAFLRPGRLDLQFEISAPDIQARKSIFEIHLRETPSHNVNLEQLAEMTDGFSGADIEWCCTIAKQRGLERYIISGAQDNLLVTHEDLIKATQDIKKRKY